MKIVELRQEHLEPLSRFLAGLPDRDRTFAGDDVAGPMILGTLATRPGRRWVAVADGDSQEITGFVSVHRHAGWSDHVASLRLVVHPDHRHGGVGTDLARRALAGSLSEGIRKIQIEIAADHESAIAMFAELGFSGEALLRDQIQGADGRYRDLVVLAHVVDDTWAAMDAVGLNEELQLLRGARSDRTDTGEGAALGRATPGVGPLGASPFVGCAVGRDRVCASGAGGLRSAAVGGPTQLLANGAAIHHAR